MTYIEKVSCYIPEKNIHIESLQDKLGLKNYQIKLFKRIHGLDRVRQHNGTTVDLIGRSILKIFEKNPHLKNDIKYMIYCHTIHNVYPYPLDLFSELRNFCGLPETINFSLNQQNCASSLVGLDVADSILSREKPGTKLLLLTGEKIFSPNMQLIPNTTIMGEGSAAVILTNVKKNIKLIKTKTKIMSQFADGYSLSHEGQKEFEKEYVPTLAEVINDILKDSGLELSDISIILPHNVNISSWRKVAEYLGFPLQRIYLKNVPLYSHCFCSDPFINLDSVLKEYLLKNGDYFLMASVGLGATFAVSLLQYNEVENGN